MGTTFIKRTPISDPTVVVFGPFGHGLVAGAPAAASPAPRAVRRRRGHRGVSLDQDTGEGDDAAVAMVIERPRMAPDRPPKLDLF